MPGVQNLLSKPFVAAKVTRAAISNPYPKEALFPVSDRKAVEGLIASLRGRTFVICNYIMWEPGRPILLYGEDGKPFIALVYWRFAKPAPLLEVRGASEENGVVRLYDFPELNQFNAFIVEDQKELIGSILSSVISTNSQSHHP